MFLRATVLIVLSALAVVTSAATGKDSGNATQDSGNATQDSGNATQDSFSWPPDDAVFSTNLDVDWDSVGVAVKDTPEYETSKWKEPEQETLRTIVIPSDAAPGTFASINDKATGDLIVALRVCAGDAKNVSASDGGNATSRSGGVGDGEVSPLFNRLGLLRG